jgi:hypothetical protein
MSRYNFILTDDEYQNNVLNIQKKKSYDGIKICTHVSAYVRRKEHTQCQRNTRSGFVTGQL